MTNTVKIINPNTKSVVFDTAERVDPPSYATTKPGVTWVRVASMRPGMPYDLITYPDEWIVEVAP